MTPAVLEFTPKRLSINLRREMTELRPENRGSFQ